MHRRIPAIAADGGSSKVGERIEVNAHETLESESAGGGIGETPCDVIAPAVHGSDRLNVGVFVSCADSVLPTIDRAHGVVKTRGSGIADGGSVTDAVERQRNGAGIGQRKVGFVEMPKVQRQWVRGVRADEAA